MAVCLPERRISHAETRAHVFGKQFDGPAVGYRIRLSQVSHRFDQEPLAINIARIGCPFASLASKRRKSRDSENLGHGHRG